MVGIRLVCMGCMQRKCRRYLTAVLTESKLRCHRSAAEEETGRRRL